MLHRPLCHNTTVVLYVYLIAKYASASADIERKKKKVEERGPPQFALINGVAILESDVARHINGASAVLS